MPNFIELQKEGKTHIINIDAILAIVVTHPTSEYININGVETRVEATKEIVDVYSISDPEPFRLTVQMAKPLLSTIRRQFTIHP